MLEHAADRLERQRCLPECFVGTSVGNEWGCASRDKKNTPVDGQRNRFVNDPEKRNANSM